MVFISVLWKHPTFMSPLNRKFNINMESMFVTWGTYPYVSVKLPAKMNIRLISVTWKHPSAYVSAELISARKHVAHIRHFGNIPFAYVSVETNSARKHRYCTRHFGNIPFADVSVKTKGARKHLIHARHFGNVQLLISPLNFGAHRNMAFMFVTLGVHLLMSPVKFDFLKRFSILVTRDKIPICCIHPGLSVLIQRPMLV